MSDRALMQQALEALEYKAHGPVSGEKDLTDRAIRDAEKQEPVAWMVYTLDGKSVCVTANPSDFTDEHRALPLYTTPPAAQRQPILCGCGDEIVPNTPAKCWNCAAQDEAHIQQLIKGESHETD